MNKDIVKDVIELKEHNEQLQEKLNSTKECLYKIQARERLYQSTLQNLKNDLRKFYERIDVTPHSHDPEYGEKFYSDDSKYKQALDAIQEILNDNCRHTCGEVGEAGNLDICGVIDCPNMKMHNIIKEAKEQ